MPGNPTLEEAIKEAMALADSTAEYVYTLEVRHESITEPLYLVQGWQNLDITLETDEVVRCQASPFALKLPSTNDTGLQELNVTFDDVGRKVSDFCRIAAKFPTEVVLIFRPYLATDLTECQMNPPLRLTLKTVEISPTQVSGRAITADFLNSPYPTIRYTVERFPGLKGV